MMKQYLELFFQESSRHLDKIEALLDGSDDAGAEEGALIDALFREFHSFKGMAATMGYEAMRRLANRVEDKLGEARSGGEFGDIERELCMRCADRLVAMCEDVAGGGSGELGWTDLFDASVGGVDSRREAPATEDMGAEMRERRIDSLIDERFAPAPGNKAGSGHGMPGADGPRRGVSATVYIDEDCPTPAARACVIVKRFKESVPNLTSVPGLDELMPGVKIDRVKVVLPGIEKRTAEEIFATLTEVTKIVFDEAPTVAGPTLAPGNECAAELGGGVGRRRAVDGGPAVEPPDDSARAARLMLPDSIEVPTAVLDELVELAGELTLARARIRELAAARGSSELREESRLLDALGRKLEERVLGARCFPFSTVVSRLRRFIREESQRLGKSVRLEVEGASIGVDKALMSNLSGPIMHLLRNALDHGIEEPAERLAADKDTEGVISIGLTRDRTSLKLTISDDGRGIDVEKVRAGAVSRGAVTEQASHHLDERALLDLIFMAGVSSKDEASGLSGRGVGLDAVRSDILALGGDVSFSSEAGRGSMFVLDLPVSPAIAPVLLMECGQAVLGIPVHNIAHAFELEAEEVRRDEAATQEHSGWFMREGERVDLHDLAARIGQRATPPNGRRAVVELSEARGGGCWIVDRLLREEHVFVKPLKGRWERLRGIGGYSLTGDGRVVYLVEAAELCAE